MKIRFGINILLLVLGATNAEVAATHGGGDASATDSFVVPHDDLDEQTYEDDEKITSNLRGGGQGHRKLRDYITLSYDNFENSWGSFKKVKDPEDPKDAIRVSNPESDQQKWVCEGTAALRIRDCKGRDSSVFLKADQNFTDFSKVTVGFLFSPRSIDNNDRFYLEYSPEGGIAGSWILVKEFVSDVKTCNTLFDGTKDCPSQNGPTHIRDNDNSKLVFTKNTHEYQDLVSLSRKKYLFTDKARIRFRCDASGDGDMVYIDQVHIRGYYIADQ